MALIIALFTIILTSCGIKEPTSLHIVTDLNVESIDVHDAVLTKEGFEESYVLKHQKHIEFLYSIHYSYKKFNSNVLIDIVSDSNNNIHIITLSEHRD